LVLPFRFTVTPLKHARSLPTAAAMSLSPDAFLGLRLRRANPREIICGKRTLRPGREKFLAGDGLFCGAFSHYPANAPVGS